VGLCVEDWKGGGGLHWMPGPLSIKQAWCLLKSTNGKGGGRCTEGSSDILVPQASHQTGKSDLVIRWLVRAVT
jgi:hypothetical protein